MNRLVIDLETSSQADIQAVGSIAYAMHPTTKVQLFGYRFDEDQPVVVDMAAGETLPQEVIDALTSQETIKYAFNAQFEIEIINRVLGIKTLSAQWRDLQAMSAYSGYPNKLEHVPAAIGLNEDESKLKDGKELVKLFSVQENPDTTSADWKRYKNYNRQDVISESAVRKHVEVLPAREHLLWRLTYIINKRGVGVDTEYVDAAIKMRADNKERLKSYVKERYGIENAGSRKQMLEWINNHLGRDYASLDKEHVAIMRETITDPDVLDLLDVWSKINKSSLAKYQVIKEATVDGRVYTGCAYYGAGQTGRWASYIIQLHNLPRGDFKLESEDFELIKAGDIDTLELKYGNVAGVLSSGIRGSFVPKPGHVFIISDFAAIEARVLAWLADEKWRMEVFATTGKIYEASAERMFGLEPGSVTKDSPYRRSGKIAELALGYGGWEKALERMEIAQGTPTRERLSEEQRIDICRKWRNSNRGIVGLWKRAGGAAFGAVCLDKSLQIAKGIFARRDQGVMWLELPSGRHLAYRSPGGTADDRGFNMHFKRPVSGGAMKTEFTYGAKLIENADQAIARDCMGETIIKCRERGINLVFHVHDEVVAEVPEDQAEAKAKELNEIMSAPISWAPGLILGADTQIKTRYEK